MSVIRIGIAGLGTVGAEVLQILSRSLSSSFATFKVTAVSAKNKSKNRGLNLQNIAWVDDPINLADRDDVDVVIECMGGDGDPAYSLVKKSLQNKKSVVTANKALLAHHGAELASIAEDNKVFLGFEAAVAGGIPIIKMLREGLSANKIEAIYGILNGTSNYILTAMEKSGRDFADVLSEAQSLGYAEADPTLDVDGGDIAHKLSLLSAIAFGCRPDIGSFSVDGIRFVTAEDIKTADELGYRIKCIGQARREEDGGILQMVAPSLVPKSSPLAHVGGVLNAVLTIGDYVGQNFVAGRGAGAKPTASAVVADVIDLSRGHCLNPFIARASDLSAHKISGFADWQGAFYMRLVVSDRAGVLAEISPVLRDCNISVESLIQRGQSTEQPVSIIMMTHDTQGQSILDAIAKFSKLDCIMANPFVMPVLKI